MTGSFLDVDAPNTAWRGGSEDPIPPMLGRWAKTAFLYRFVTCRPLDGHARTDATFWHPGTKALTRSGHAMPYQFWPGWKRGLLMTRLPAFGLAPYTAGLTLAEYVADPGWEWYAPTGLWAPLLGYGGYSGVKYVRGFRFERQYAKPIRNAVVGALRTREGIRVELSPGLVRGRDEDAVGHIFLPPAHPLPDGDRDNLLTLVRERLSNGELDARWKMEGKPRMEIFTPAKPPSAIDWDTMMSHADTVSPYLGHAAGHAVSWHLGQDSAHLAIIGAGGSGKSELLAWVVAQFMRGGAGVVVLDPKYTSHRWLMNVPGVLYCSEAQMLHDTILWLDEELRRRGSVNRSASDDQAFARLVVVLEERNSLTTMLRELWRDIAPQGRGQTRSPALTALDRLSSQGRSLGINVILAAQSHRQNDIGPRDNFAASAIAGRMPDAAWRAFGAKRPAVGTQPGRFGYVIGQSATVMQTAFPDLKHHAERLIEFATGGEQILDVQVMMTQHEMPPFPSSGAVSSDHDTPVYFTLREFAVQNDIPVTTLNNWRQRDTQFPEPAATVGTTKKYWEHELTAYAASRNGETNA